MLMTAADIQLFYENALCAFGCKFGVLTAKAEKGQRMDKEVIAELKLVGIMIDSIYGYNPDATTNCTTYEEIYNIIQYIAVKLSLCITQLEPVQAASLPDGIGYMYVEFGANIQYVG